MSYTPATDFYSYVNKAWLLGRHMPDYEDSYNISDEVEDKVNDRLLACIESHRLRHPTHPLSVLVSSSTRGDEKNVKAVQHQLDELRTTEDIGHAIGMLNSLQCHSPINVFVRRNCRGHCCIYIGEGTFGLPESKDYSNPRTVAKYKAYLSAIGDKFGISHLETVFTTENRFAKTAFHGDENEEKTFAFDELCARFAHIPWKSIMTGFGIPESLITHTEYRIDNILFIKQLNSEYSSVSRLSWIRWLQSMFLHGFLEYLPTPYSDLHFELYGHYLKGHVLKPPQHIELLQALNDYVPQLMGSVCIDAVSSADIKLRATELVRHLKHSTHCRISEAAWLHVRTRQKALEKVAAMKFQVAFPNRWQIETDGVTLSPDCFVTNLMTIGKRENELRIRQLANDDCGRNPSDWMDSPFVVNAYYYTDKNMLMIPAASLRPPFFDARRSLASNLGGVGSVIAHEISHGFDGDGRLYDARGFLKNWWLPRDEAAYNKITRKIIKLFESVPYMGRPVNGRRTLDENIADLCGLSIALGALKDSMLTVAASERQRAYRDFFTGYATSWRTIMRLKKAKFALRTSVHAPAKLRVNLIVKQFDEFYEAFDIREDAEGWIEPSKRIRFW
jgi:putative endopeptidase